MDALRLHGLISAKLNLEPVISAVELKGGTIEEPKKVLEIANSIKTHLFGSGDVLLSHQIDSYSASDQPINSRTTPDVNLGYATTRGSFITKYNKLIQIGMPTATENRGNLRIYTWNLSTTNPVYQGAVDITIPEMPTDATINIQDGIYVPEIDRIIIGESLTHRLYMFDGLGNYQGSVSFPVWNGLFSLNVLSGHDLISICSSESTTSKGTGKVYLLNHNLEIIDSITGTEVEAAFGVDWGDITSGFYDPEDDQWVVTNSPNGKQYYYREVSAIKRTDHTINWTKSFSVSYSGNIFIRYMPKALNGYKCSLAHGYYNHQSDLRYTDYRRLRLTDGLSSRIFQTNTTGLGFGVQYPWEFGTTDYGTVFISASGYSCMAYYGGSAHSASQCMRPNINIAQANFNPMVVNISLDWTNSLYSSIYTWMTHSVIK